LDTTFEILAFGEIAGGIDAAQAYCLLPRYAVPWLDAKKAGDMM
jgi:hypothetical protein